jgi:hypothetical protein
MLMFNVVAGDRGQGFDEKGSQREVTVPCRAQSSVMSGWCFSPSSSNLRPCVPGGSKRACVPSFNLDPRMHAPLTRSFAAALGNE